MITFLLIALLGVSLGLNVATLILIRILLKKNSIHEQWILEFQQDVSNTLQKMRDIDTRGSFSSGGVDNRGKFEHDDEIGQVFKDLEELINELNDRVN